MTTTDKLLMIVPILVISIVFAVLTFGMFEPKPALGNAPMGLPTTIATTSNPSVTTSAALVFATSTCDARTITTYASPIMITFSDRIGQRPTGTFGHLQAASTTVVYDSGQVGCGAVYIYSFATQAITVSEGR